MTRGFHSSFLLAMIVLAGLACALNPPPVPPVVTDPVPAEPIGPEIHYNRLGRTGLMVSDIGHGTAGTTDPAVIRYALDQGINYFDTAENYGSGRSESAIGPVAAERRDEMVICTKLGMSDQTTKEEIHQRLDACLERLQTGYVDIFMIHTANPEATGNPAIWEAIAELKEQGKIRWVGASTHGPAIVATLRPLVEADKLDVILCSYDPTAEPELMEFFQEAHAKDVGLVAMKVFNAARQVELQEFDSGEQPFHLAAVRWALTTSTMHTHLVSMNMMDQVDEFVAVSGTGKE